MRAIHFAPLQGYTDGVYRDAHTKIFGGVERYYTPFVRVERGGFRNRDIRELVRSEWDGARLIPQLIASKPEEMEVIVSLFRENGYNEIDINMGCPFPKQVNAHRGSGLLCHRAEAEALLGSIKRFEGITFSIKLRLGWESAEEVMALIPLLNDLPLSHVTLHPRLGRQQYKGDVDWDGFTRFYESCEHPLFYNGDILSIDDINRVFDRFPKLSGVMVGRGLLASPWLAHEYISGEPFSRAERSSRLMMFHDMLLNGYASSLEGGEGQLLMKMKSVWDYLLPDADKKMRKKIVKSNTLTSYQEAARALLSL